MRHVMLDIETLGLTPGSVVTAFAAVAFTEDEILDSVSHALDIVKVQRAGFTMDASTTRWWMQQGDEAIRRSLFGTMDPCAAAVQFHNWCGGHNAQRFWARGQDFDFPIMEAFQRHFIQAVPWDYNQKRDTRTIVDDHLPKIDRPEFEGVQHDPLSDAVHEVRCLQATWRRMR